MPGRKALRACMLGLVLANLVFVHLTEAASATWLTPLFALTLLSPLLARFRENLVYRGLWNAGVLGVFAVLLRHAADDNLRYVLEDGLVLAALCQVHLLNNLRSEQRPDLLFFNSFLIAIVTGFLSQDISFAFVFTAYALCFVIGLQLHCLLADRATDLSPATTAYVAWDGCRRASVLLACTLLAFLFWPRDFDRKSALSGELQFASQHEETEIGFNDRVELEQRGPARASSRMVLRVTLRSGSAGNVPSLWRGATLGETDGGEWWPLRSDDRLLHDGGDVTWGFRGDSLVRGEQTSTRLSVDVEGLDTQAGRIFAPLSAQRLQLAEGLRVEDVTPMPDATIRQSSPMGASYPKVRYQLRLAETLAEPAGIPPPAPTPGIARYTDLPDSAPALRARKLALSLVSTLPDDSPQHLVVEQLRLSLGARFEYVLPGEPDAAQSLEEFLSGGAGGHCEYFASAMGTMLRTLSIPCRLVTGYRSDDWDADGRVLTFRSQDAHAWVEVFDPAAGWYAVDPTPAASYASTSSLWAQLRASTQATWDKLTGFDAESRAAAMAWAAALPDRAWAAAAGRPERSLGILTLLAAAVALVARYRGRTENAAVRAYERELQRAGIKPLPGVTPRELLARAEFQELPRERLDSLRAATATHEAQRYAS